MPDPLPAVLHWELLKNPLKAKKKKDGKETRKGKLDKVKKKNKYKKTKKRKQTEGYGKIKMSEILGVPY